jgi:hypothetical protein
LILIDSSYLHEEIIAKQIGYMKTLSANGAQDEFQAALREFQQGEFSHAINEAAKSVESTLKFIMEGNVNGDLTKLLKELEKKDLMPSYYGTFFESFLKIVQATGITRNQPGNAHGQGNNIINPPRSLAEFEINLAATINKFLLECYMEKEKKIEKPSPTPDDSINLDDLPF